MVLVAKNSTANTGDRRLRCGFNPCGENPLEEEIATHLPGESHGQNLHVLQVDALLLSHWERSNLMLNLTIKCRVF